MELTPEQLAEMLEKAASKGTATAMQGFESTIDAKLAAAAKVEAALPRFVQRVIS